jgi:ribosomal protein L16/L10AE
MGKGKGKYRCVVGNILKNEIILEFTCLDFYFYSSFIYSAISKLPVRIELVFNENRINTFSVRRFEEPDSLYQEFYEIT